MVSSEIRGPVSEDYDAAHSPRLGRCNFFAGINLIRWRETMGSKDGVKLTAIFPQEVTGILVRYLAIMKQERGKTLLDFIRRNRHPNRDTEGHDHGSMRGGGEGWHWCDFLSSVNQLAGFRQTGWGSIGLFGFDDAATNENPRRLAKGQGPLGRRWPFGKKNPSGIRCPHRHGRQKNRVYFIPRQEA